MIPRYTSVVPDRSVTWTASSGARAPDGVNGMCTPPRRCVDNVGGPSPLRWLQMELNRMSAQQDGWRSDVVVHPDRMGVSTEILNADISLLEVEQALKRMPNFKAPGIDSIRLEWIKYGATEMANALLPLLHHCFNEGEVPDSWRKGLVCPIPKLDQQQQPEKCRPITVLNVVLKIFCAVLNARFRIWCQRFDILLEEQAGFLPQRSCMDQIFTLRAIVQEMSPKPVYCAFIDVSKAYDSVWRGIVCGWRGSMVGSCVP